MLNQRPHGIVAHDLEDRDSDLEVLEKPRADVDGDERVETNFIGLRLHEIFIGHGHL